MLPDIKYSNLIESNAFFKKAVKHIATAVDEAGMPDIFCPEVVFCGRSNAGKSSLINVLTNSKIARVAKAPGKTRTINFYSMLDKIRLVDLPGYGYAKVSKSEIKKWANFIAYYMNMRENLYRAFLLIDSRRGIQESDNNVINWLSERDVECQIVLTKIDKMKKDDIDALKEDIWKNYKSDIYPRILSTSSIKREGMSELRYEIVSLIKEMK